MARQVAKGDLLLAGQGIDVRQGHDQRLLHQKLIDHLGIVDAGPGEGDVDGPPDQGAAKLRRVHGVQHQVDVGVVGAKGVQNARQQGIGGRADEADVEHADGAFRRPTRHPRRLDNAAQNLTGSGQQRLAGHGQPDLVAGAVEQGGADRRLQLDHLATERRLGDVEPFRGAPEMELFSDGHEIAQAADIDARGFGKRIHRAHVRGPSGRTGPTA
ncbi:hypothetical protein D3C73_433610 [compost metagenome]